MRTYEITDEGRLLADFPNLFKTVVDHVRVRKAPAAGFALPGVEFIPTPIEEAINKTKENK